MPEAALEKALRRHGCRPEADGGGDLLHMDVKDDEDGEARGILEVLRGRYEQGHIYTYLGGVLLALNPHERLRYCHDEELARMYQRAAAPDSIAAHAGAAGAAAGLLPGTRELFRGAPHEAQFLPAHAIAVAEGAYRAVASRAAGGSPSIVIIGENGAGKTETAKIVAGYLVTRAGAGGPPESPSRPRMERFRRLIASMDVVLEAFGNAFTPHNPNSSRFGRMLKLRYGARGLVGASVEQYMLERNRLVKHDASERRTCP